MEISSFRNLIFQRSISKSFRKIIIKTTNYFQKIKIIFDKIKLNEPKIENENEKKAVLILQKDGIKVNKLKNNIIIKHS